MIFPSWLRNCAAMIVMAGLLGMGAGCKKAGNSNGSITVSGTVSFTRIPVTYSNGEVGNSGVTLARGVVVRVFQLYYDLDQAGQKHQNWRLGGISATDSNGFYSVGGNVFPGYPTFIEVQSVFQQSGGHGSVVQLIADKDGINSSVPGPKRPIYVYRAGMDGQPLADNVIDADNSQPPVHPIRAITDNATVNVSVGTDAKWLATLPTWYVPGSVANPSLTQQQAPPIGDPLALGGAPLAILDDAFLISFFYGDPTPSQVTGGVLDLHYYPGRTEPGRSFVVYDTRLTPNSVDGAGKAHYFGSLAGGSTFDDAWDQRVIFPILARNFLYGQAKTALFPTGSSTTLSLSPDLALVDGLGDAMTAILVGSTHLTDTSAGVAPNVTRDISVIPALPVISTAIPSPAIASPANLAALAWHLILKVNGTRDPAVMARFFNLINPSITSTGPNGDATVQADIPSIFGQVGRLLEGKQSGEPADLSQSFTNLSLITDLAPFGILWPADATLPGATDWPPHLATDWNPNRVAPGPQSVTEPITFSMANARQIPDPLTGTPSFPNSSQGEVAYGKLAIFYDTYYKLSVTADPLTPIPAGATIEVVVDGHISSQIYSFSASSQVEPILTLKGTPRDTTNPVLHFIRIRLVYPGAPGELALPDLQVTVNLVRTNNP